MDKNNSVIWSPSPEIIEKSNVKRFMDRNGIAAYGELINFSINDSERFWKAVVEDLKIEFF